jgi:hypothetical protein
VTRRPFPPSLPPGVVDVVAVVAVGAVVAVVPVRMSARLAPLAMLAAAKPAAAITTTASAMLEILFIPDELLLLFSWADIGTAAFGLKHEMPGVACFLR